MPRKYQCKDVQKQRASNYAFYVAERQRFLALPEGVRALLISLSRNIEMPTLNLMGATDGDGVDMAWKIGQANGVDIELRGLILPVFTDEGWAIFQELWKALPEPIEFVHIPVDKWSVFHKQHSESVHRGVDKS